MRSSHILIKIIAVISALSFIVSPITGFAKVNQYQQPKEEEKVVAKQVDKQQLQCLADNIFYEAGGESTEGKAAVARVVLNRINSGFAPTPCKVVYQSNTVKQTNDDDETFWVRVCQFSWVCEGKGNPNRNSHRYQTSLQVAKDVLIYDKYKEIIPKTAVFFHNTSVVNNYPHEVLARIGNHIFYKKKHGKHSKKSGTRYVRSQRISGDATIES